MPKGKAARSPTEAATLRTEIGKQGADVLH